MLPRCGHALTPLWAALALTSLTTGCAAPTSGDSACVALRPIYADEADIGAMSRALKEKIAAHNRTWEGLCAE